VTYGAGQRYPRDRSGRRYCNRVRSKDRLQARDDDIAAVFSGNGLENIGGRSGDNLDERFHFGPVEPAVAGRAHFGGGPIRRAPAAAASSQRAASRLILRVFSNMVGSCRRRPKIVLSAHASIDRFSRRPTSSTYMLIRSAVVKFATLTIGGTREFVVPSLSVRTRRYGRHQSSCVVACFGGSGTGLRLRFGRRACSRHICS
jgi:hypothetical protein